jgi:bifunctional UDP-N-acetylglucosamine pyrophosphorylase/glucosamine-1-phosphate N-acetyltransferase
VVDSVILAAGGGTRMKSKTPKVLHNACGAPIIDWVIESADVVSENIIVVIGHESAQVRGHLESNKRGGKLKYAEQKQLLGTGHAVMQARDVITADTTLIIAGDVPLITGETLKNALEFHKKSQAEITIITANFKKPFGYGRIVRDSSGNIVKIVEEKDANAEQRAISEVNSGVYFFNTEFLKSLEGKISRSNAQGEFYLTDSIEIAVSEGKKAAAFLLKDSREMLGVNSREQLAKVEKLLRGRIIKNHMENGVTFIDTRSSYIGKNVKIGQDTIIYPQTAIEGSSVIGEDCVIRGSRISDSVIGNGAQVENSLVISSKIGEKTVIGPFAYVRPNCVIGDGNRIGDFVELKNSNIGNGTKISHLTYVGDADVGENVNFGCGSVVVNYDGKKKTRSEVQDGAFIGCNVNLISPVVVEKDAFIAAGSTITKNVPSKGLAIARPRQENKENWVKE